MDQNNFQNPVAVPKNDKLLPILISILLTALVVGFGVFYFVNQSSQSEIKSLQDQVDELRNKQTNTSSGETPQNQDVSSAGSPNTGSILLAMKNKQQNPPPSNPGNLVNEYFVVAYDPKTGEQKQSAIIKNNFFTEPFGFSNNKIFFETPTGEVGSLDTKSLKQETIKISGIIPTNRYLNENTLSDFLVSGNKLFYLKGHCSEGLYCALGVYDISTGNNQIILDNLDKQVKSAIFDVTKLVSHDSAKNILRIRDSGGEAGFASGSLYELNLNTKVLTEIDSASSEYCGESEADCTPQQKAENEKFDRIFSKPQINCNGAVIIDSYNKVSISGKNFEDTLYIGCVN